LAFGHLYCLLDAIAPGSLRGNAEFAIELGDGETRFFRLTYFSLATLTTLGYGDFIPATDAARGLAVVEAILGQFYIAVLVAELIGRRVSQALSGQRDRSDGPDGQ
jgi:voltage-gated potassium channel Kch